MKKGKYGTKTPDRVGEEKTLVNTEDASCNLIMGIPTEELDGLPYPGLVFCQTSSQEVLQMEPITDESKEMFSHKKRNDNIMCVGDTILAAAEEAVIDKKIVALSNKNQHTMPSSMENIFQI